MARFALTFPSLAFAVVAFAAVPGWAVQPSELLLPSTTKGYISTLNVDEARARFEETQLGQMVNDPVMKPFIEDLRQQIGQKLERAGKKLGVKWEDLEGVYAGEVALALVQPDPKDKQSHATVLLVDVTGKQKQVNDLLAKIDRNQQAQRAARSAAQSAGIQMTVYTHPLKAGEKRPEQVFYFIKDEQLVMADHGATIGAIAGRFAGNAKDALSALPAFRYSMSANEKATAGAKQQVRWFVEPFGYVEASRAAQGGRRKRGTDMLKIIQSQGFSAVQGAGGYVFFATGEEEVLHRTYVYAPPVTRQQGDARKDKYNLAMRMLDFPNDGNLTAQPWVLPDLATYLTFNWKMREAFDYSETLVDAIAGDKGVFKEIWQSLKIDPHGPKIDIYNGLVNHLGTRATLLSDVSVPVGPRSERLLALVEVTKPEVVAATVEKAFKDDPAAKKRVIRGQTIWEITQDETLTEEPELMIEGAGFVSTADTTTVAQEEGAIEDKVLPNMAITVFNGHLVISTHVDFIEELIANADKPNGLATMDDYLRVEKSLTRLGAGKDAFRFFTRTDKSYRATYELIRQGKLPESETVLAQILNGLMGSSEEGAVRKQEIDGKQLPPYQAVEKYFGPGGTFVQQEENGWWVVGCLLTKQPKPNDGEVPPPLAVAPGETTNNK